MDFAFLPHCFSRFFFCFVWNLQRCTLRARYATRIRELFTFVCVLTRPRSERGVKRGEGGVLRNTATSDTPITCPTFTSSFWKGERRWGMRREPISSMQPAADRVPAASPLPEIQLSAFLFCFRLSITYNFGRMLHRSLHNMSAGGCRICRRCYTEAWPN